MGFWAVKGNKPMGEPCLVLRGDYDRGRFWVIFCERGFHVFGFPARAGNMMLGVFGSWDTSR